MEDVCYRIKNNLPIGSCSDDIINLVDDLNIMNDKYKEDNDVNAHYGEDFIPKIYSLIAPFFISNTLIKDRYIIESKQWICCNCNNRNFSRLINRKQQCNLSMYAHCVEYSTLNQSF